MYFAYTPPLPPSDAFTVGSALHLAAVCLCFVAAAILAALPPRRVPTRPAPATPPGGPVYDPTARRWRDPQSRRFVKAPRAIAL